MFTSSKDKDKPNASSNGVADTATALTAATNANNVPVTTKSALAHLMEFASIPLSKRFNTKNIAAVKNMYIPITEDLQLATSTWGEINWGGDLNIYDPNTGFTPLMNSVISNNLYTMKTLIERGADVHFQDPMKGRTATIIASKYGQQEALDMLCHYGGSIYGTDNMKMTALMHAVKGGHTSIVKSLVYRSVMGIDMVDAKGWSALHYAATYGYKDIIEILCDVGAIINQKDFVHGKQPIILAAQNGRKECVKLLHDKGADINSTSSKEHVTPLMMASKEGHKGTVVIIVECGCKPNLFDIYGWTALHFASAWGRKETIGILLTYGKSNPNFQARAKHFKQMEISDDEKSYYTTARSGGKYIGQFELGGNTPLMIAAKAEQIEVIDILLEYGAKLEIKSVIDGKTALAHASVESNVVSVIHLLDKGANANTVNSNLQTPIMQAGVLGHFDMMVILLNYFADINMFDDNGHNVMKIVTNANKRDVFLSAILSSSPMAKANIIPWIEAEFPKMDASVGPVGGGGPTAFLNSLLYGANGLYVGLLQRPEDCDAYLIYSLVMLATAFKTAAHNFPLTARTLNEKVLEIDAMLESCTKAQGMYVIENLGDSLLLGKKRIEVGDFRIQSLSNAFYTGPLALCIQHRFTNMLYVPSIEMQMASIFSCCLRRVVKVPSRTDSVTYVGAMDCDFGCTPRHSSWLLYMRYCPIAMFALEGIIRCALLLSIIYVSSATPVYLTASKSTNALPLLELVIVVITATTFMYELGLLENKSMSVPASIVLDKDYIYKSRRDALWCHFMSDVWKVFDSCWMLLCICYTADLIQEFSYNGDTRTILSTTKSTDFDRDVLAIAAIPLALSLIRYPATLYKSFGQFAISVFNHTVDLFYLLVIFAFTGLGFGVFFTGMYRNDKSNVYFGNKTSTFYALFDMIFLNYDLSMLLSSQVTATFSVIFIVWCCMVLSNMVIARIVSTNSDIDRQSGLDWILVKSNTILQHLPVYENSPLCMLPAPFNAIPIALYVPHQLHISFWKCFKSVSGSRKASCTSLAGTVCDKCIYLIFVVPAAMYEYLMLYSDLRVNCILILCCPITIMCYILSLLYRCFVTDYVTKVLLQSRLASCRLRVSYGDSRDQIECIGVRERHTPATKQSKASDKKGKRLKPSNSKYKINDSSNSSKVKHGKVAPAATAESMSVSLDNNGTVGGVQQVYGIIDKSSKAARVVFAEEHKQSGDYIDSKKDSFLMGNDDAGSVASLLSDGKNSVSIYDGSQQSLTGDDDSSSIASTTSMDILDGMESIVSYNSANDSFIRKRPSVITPAYHIVPESLDFPSRRYAKIYLRQDQSAIFKDVLPDYFSNEYTRALKETSGKLENLNENVMQRIYELERSQDAQLKDVLEMLVVMMKSASKSAAVVNYNNIDSSQVNLSSESIRSNMDDAFENQHPLDGGVSSIDTGSFVDDVYKEER